MEINNYLSMFDEYIVASGFNRSDISKWFRKLSMAVYFLYKIESQNMQK
jgi:hypothetical protein